MVVNFIFNIRKDSEEQSRISLELIHSRTWRSWERPWRALVSRMNFLSSVPHCSCHDLLRDLIFNYIETVWAAVLESRGLYFTVCSEILLLLPHVSFVVANRSTLWITVSTDTANDPVFTRTCVFTSSVQELMSRPSSTYWGVAPANSVFLCSKLTKPPTAR